MTEIQKYFTEIPPTKDQDHFTMNLPADPLTMEPPLLIKTEDGKIVIPPVEFINFMGKKVIMHPTLELPLALYSPKKELNVVEANLTVNFMNVEGRALTMRLTQKALAIELGGIQSRLAGVFNTGLIPATCPLNLPVFFHEAETEAQMLINAPTLVKKLGKEAYLQMYTAAEQQLPSPFQLPEYPLPETLPTKEESTEYAKVYSNLRKRRASALKMEPTQTPVQILSGEPFHEFPKAKIAAEVQNSTHEAKRQKIIDQLKLINQNNDFQL